MFRPQRPKNDNYSADQHVHRQSAPQKKEYKTRRVPEKQMIFGIRAVLEAIDAGKEFDKIMLRRDMSSDLARQLLAKLNGLTTPIQRVPVEKLNQLTDKNHQGVIAFISPIQFSKIEDVVPTIYEEGRMPAIMVLDGITDVRNLGAIARTCSCAGVDALLIPARGVASINADAVKTSAGALHTLPVCRVENLKNALQFLKDSGLNIVAATEHTDKDYTQADFNRPIAIVMGAEDEGIDPTILDMCDTQVRIPMFGNIESLNVSVAAGVVMYEMVRQRNNK